MVTNYKYYAFISYSSHDTAWGKRLQRKLEGYRMSTTLCRKHGWERKPMRPVFFAPTDIQPGGLTEELQERLRASRHLVVICSPHSAQSYWVGEEIAFFHALGRTKNIHFFIVDGQPHSGDNATECFNPVVEKLGLPEILGANIHEEVYRWKWMNRERAYVQLITKLLGIEFDAVWKRHRRLLVEKIVAWVAGVLVVLAALAYVWMMNKPVDVSVRLKEVSVQNEQLPPLKDAVVTVSLDNETKTDTIGSLDGCALFANVPHRFLHKEVHVTVVCRDFHPVDTMLLLSEDLCLNISRDADVYGKVRFHVWNAKTESFVSGVGVRVNGYQAVSDKDGCVSLNIPLEAQRKTYHVAADVPLADDTIYMPSGENDVIEVASD